ncbi:hypothetical protein AK830_g2383 [Neonectria ditissima]|uniref:LysM domain-containing protein n=1 Tax=Neonectria ditissima TaxID=78410 RepID=A0A0P7BBE1_9HYPO|nr:hypothetical protein AK830_g2383 [Neonectria ditissima]
MRLPLILTQGLLSSGPVLRRQNGPTDPGIPSDCTWWELAVDKSFDCDFFEADWDLTHDQFVEYNPSVKDNCSGIQVGHAYCVEVNHGLPRDEDPPKLTTTEGAEPEPTEDSKLSPTQDGLIDTCTSFYKASKGDTCTKIIAQYRTFDFNTFFKWNPAVGKDCSGIWASTYYCVGVPGTPTTKPSATTAKPTATNGIQTPSPIQDDMVKNCNKFHLVKDGKKCSTVASKNNISIPDFLEWNPKAGSGCTGLKTNVYACVSIIGSTPTKPDNGIKTPTPTQPNMVHNCNKFHLVQSGEKCSTVANSNGVSIPNFLKWNPEAGAGCTGLKTDANSISIPDFLEWNPKAGTGCTGLKTDAYACVWTINYKPTPVQGTLIRDCKKYHFVAKGQVCKNIQKKYSVTLANLYKWNPAIGKDCRSMWAEVYICVGV